MTVHDALKIAAEALISQDDLSRRALADACEESGMEAEAEQLRGHKSPMRVLQYSGRTTSGDIYDVRIDTDSIMRQAIIRAANTMRKRANIFFKAIRAKRRDVL